MKSDNHRPIGPGASFGAHRLGDLQAAARLVRGLAGIFVLSLLGPEFAAADDFDNLRTAWVQSLTGGTNYSLTDNLVKSRISSISSTASNYWNSMNKLPARTNLWSDLASTTDSGQISAAYSRIRALALAFATYGCPLRSNATLVVDIQGALDWMYTNRYNELSVEYDNWYDWEIATPLSLTDLATLMYDALGANGLSNSMNAVNRFVPSPTNGGRVGTFTGSNLADKLRAVAVRGAVVKDGTKLAAARDALSILFSFVKSGDGFYADGSFVQHDSDPYHGGYGATALADVAAVLPWLAGSSWQVTDPLQTNIFQWVYCGYEPLLYSGAMMDMTSGRYVSRSSSQDHVIGGGIMQSLLRLSQFAPSPDAARLRSMVKYWAQVDTFRSFGSNVPLPLVAVTEQLLADAATPPRGELVGHWNFSSMDRIVHLRPGWGLGLSLSSSRIYNFESINNENRHGWFEGDGAMWFFNSDLGQFSDDFWPTVDPYRLPGTTVETTPRANGAGQSSLTPKSWVGGVTLASNGTAGLDLAPVNSPLTGKKSWFMIGDEVACLGAGFTCSNAAPVQTTVENRKLSRANTNGFTADGTVCPLTLGWSTNFASASWCALDGAGGWYFPGGAGLQVLREARTNAWSQINGTGATNLIVNNYLTLWLDHGTRPTNAAYAYVSLPNFTAAQAAAYASNPALTILENSTNAQAVKENAANIIAVNFWADATKTLDLITVNKPASVMTQESATDLAVAISDPTQTNSGSVAVTLNRSAAGVAAADAGITVTQLRPTIQFTANYSNSFGRSITARFNYLNSPPALAPVSDHAASVGVPLMVTNAASDPDLPFQSLSFSLLAGPTNAVINSTNGVVTWRPALFQAGTTNVFSISVSDNGTPSLSSTGTFKVTVNPVAQPAVRLTVSGNHQATLNISGDFGPDYLVLASTNLVNWTTIYASNSPVLPLIWTDAQSGLFARRFYRVLLGPAAPTLAAQPDVLVNAGASLLVTNAAADPNLPPLNLTFSLVAGPAGASINPTNGVISWRPSVTQASTTNQYIVEVANSGVPSLITTQSFTAVVNPISPPSAALTLAPDGTPSLRVSGGLGPDYSIFASTNLVNWDAVFSTNSPVTPFVWTDSPSALFKRRFYRVAIGP